MFFVTRDYIEGFVSALSETTGIKFVEGRGFGVDLKNNVFRYDPVVLQKAYPEEVKGILLHEVGHLLYTRETPDTKIEKKYPRMRDIYNILEDQRIEALTIKKYGEFASDPISLSRMFASISNSMLGDWQVRAQSKYTQGCALLCSHMMASSSTGLQDVDLIKDYSSTFYYKVSGEVRKKLFTNENIRMFEKILKIALSARDTAEIKKIADDYLFPIFEEWLKEDKKQEAEMHGTISEAISELDKLMQTTGNLLKRLDGDVGGRAGARPPTRIPPDKELKELYQIDIYNLTSRMKAILQEMNTIKYNGSFKRGKLLSKNIYKVKTRDNRLYSKRNNPDNPFYAVTFIVDESGSMGGGKYTNSYIAMYIINAACQNLKFKMRYLAFTYDLFEFKSFKEYRDFKGGGNNEQGIFQKLMKGIDYDNENIVFVLTDGEVESNPRPFVDKLRKQGVHVFPIGIDIHGKRSFEEWYGETLFVDKVDEISRALVSCMRRVISR